MTVYFTKNDNLILFHFNMKKLNMFIFPRIKMVKISFEIIRHNCSVLATTRNLHTSLCSHVNIRLNKNKSLVKQNLKIVVEYWKKKNYKVKGNKVFNQMTAKTKNVELTEAFIEAFSGIFTTQLNI